MRSSRLGLAPRVRSRRLRRLRLRAPRGSLASAASPSPSGSMTRNSLCSAGPIGGPGSMSPASRSFFRPARATRRSSRAACLRAVTSLRFRLPMLSGICPSSICISTLLRWCAHHQRRVPAPEVLALRPLERWPPGRGRMHETRRRAVVCRQHRLTSERGATPPLLLAQTERFPRSGVPNRTSLLPRAISPPVFVEPAIRRREASRSAGEARSIARRGSPGRRPRPIAYYPKAVVRSVRARLRRLGPRTGARGRTASDPWRGRAGPPAGLALRRVARAAPRRARPAPRRPEHRRHVGAPPVALPARPCGRADQRRARADHQRGRPLSMPTRGCSWSRSR